MLRGYAFCVRVVLAAALATALLPVSATASTSAAHVFLVSRTPVTVTGTGFRSHERVVVTVSSKSLRRATVIATARGALRIVFKRYSFAYCEPYAVRAKGNRGSTAFLKVIPECPSESPGD
jgi:hypothetical protein